MGRGQLIRYNRRRMVATKRMWIFETEWVAAVVVDDDMVE